VDLQLAQGIRPEDLYNIYSGLQRLYEYVVIDTGSALTENTVTLMDAADRILVVTTPDLASLHDTSRFVQIGRSLSYPAEKMLILLNRVGVQGGIKLRDIENALHHQIYAQIPDDGQNALRSINRGIPLVMRYPRSPASRAIRSLAKKLADINLTEGAAGAAASAASKAQKDALMASSQLG
jgi:pilus assembly protein CpaE